jgi:hypothetical protein
MIPSPIQRDFTRSVTNYKSLKEYSIEELKEFLKNNERETPEVLACICSEILRRQLL